MCILALKFVLILGLDWSGANYIHYKKSTAGKGLSSLQITFLFLFLSSLMWKKRL